MDKTTEIIAMNHGSPAAVAATPVAERAGTPLMRQTPADLYAHALQTGADLDRLERLMQMQEQWERREAEKAFNTAMDLFKANPPAILKDKHVSYQGQKGAVDYDHATHYGVCTAIAAALSQQGLSHSWTTSQEGQNITVTCTIRHRMGHFISTSMTGPYDGSGGKNAIQAIGSTKTYLERYTLLAITGLSTADMPDDDGAGAPKASPMLVEEVLQGLKAGLLEAATDKDALTLWGTGKKTLAAMGDRSAYDEFKAAVEAHRLALKGASK